MRRSSSSLPVLFALALLPGCLYITSDEGKARRAALDQDEDGATLGIDCNDHDDGRFPDNVEVSYDGIDQDCDPLLQDLLDVDGDGYAGVARAAYEAEHPGAPTWPEALPGDVVDCDDQDAAVVPGAVDTWYDGVDSDCDGEDDYDQDGDGYVSDAHDAASPLEGGDCVDTRADVGPHVDTDVLYNGVDEDCAKNNDFDADGDGYMPDATEALTATQLQSAFTDYVELYGYDFEPIYGDCDDDAPAIHPGADDAWYDGVDSNCDAVDDFDQDGDGYAFGGEDCDDVDPDVHPGTLESLADGVDQDCDGGIDTSPWSDGGYEWSSPRPVVVGKNDLHYVLTTAAEESDASSFLWTGLSLAFPLGAGAAEEPEAIVTWQSTPSTSTTPAQLGFGVDMVMGTDSFYVSTQYWNGTNSYLLGKWVYWNATAAAYASKLGYTGYPIAEQFYDDVDMAAEPGTGKYWMLGCGEGAMTFQRIDPAIPSGSIRDAFGCDADSTSCQQFSGVSADTCWLDASGATLQAHACDGTDCATYDLDGIAETMTLAATQPYDGLSWASVNRSGDWLVAVQSDGAVYLTDGSASYSVFSDDGYEARYAEVAEDASGRLFVAAVVADETGDGLEDVVLAYGDPSGAMTYVTVPLTDGATSWAAEHAAIHVDADRVMLAATGYGDPACTQASGHCDAVTWMFLSPP